jgi:Mg/Co/Ni transporter MgtE
MYQSFTGFHPPTAHFIMVTLIIVLLCLNAIFGIIYLSRMLFGKNGAGNNYAEIKQTLDRWLNKPRLSLAIIIAIYFAAFIIAALNGVLMPLCIWAFKTTFDFAEGPESLHSSQTTLKS